MKLNNEVQNALTVLRANAENNFERHRLDGRHEKRKGILICSQCGRE